jgi:hypothetical protein
MADERRFRRVPFEAEVKVSFGRQTWSCQLLDIALKGALVQSAAPLAIDLGATVALKVILSGSPLALAFEAQLAHREEDRYGFRFLHENLETLTHLRTLLELNTGDPEGIRSELLTWLKS